MINRTRKKAKPKTIPLLLTHYQAELLNDAAWGWLEEWRGYSGEGFKKDLRSMEALLKRLGKIKKTLEHPH